ncbi:MAG: SDR family oxidoreductase [Ruminococcus sp.]|nr:SDR family oxidoreductase [Ruminococcus sp.]
MKTIVIRGSTRGLGFELAKCFRRQGFNIMINGVNEKRLEKSLSALRAIKADGSVSGFCGSVAETDNINAMIQKAAAEFGSIDIWVNNAGVNQPMKPMWELVESEIDALLNIDLRAAMMGSILAKRHMETQIAGGFIYNVEGYGSNDAMMTGLNLYCTSKRALTHFTKAFAKELEESGSNVRIGRLSPGIMITDFNVKSLGGDDEIKLPEKTKKVYNILGDRPDVVAEFLSRRMIENTKNDAHIEWLTGKKAAWRFMTAGFNKRDFFAENGDQNGS